MAGGLDRLGGLARGAGREQEEGAGAERQEEGRRSIRIMICTCAFRSYFNKTDNNNNTITITTNFARLYTWFGFPGV